EERRATMLQQAEGRAALQERLAAFKAERAAIRASVGATDELGAKTRAVAENSRQIAQDGQKGVEGALRFGRAVLAARLATDGLHLATAIVKGDWEELAAAIRGVPVIGEGAVAGYGLGQAIMARTYESMGWNVRQGDTYGDKLDAQRKLAEIRERDELAAKRMRMSPDERRLAEIADRQAAETRRIEDLGEMAPGAALEARLAVEDKFAQERRQIWQAQAAEDRRLLDEQAADEAERNQAQEDAAAAAGWEAKQLADEQIEQGEIQAAERRKRLEEDNAEEIARLRIEISKTGLDRELALLDQRQNKELAVANITEGHKAQIREKYGLLKDLARQGHQGRPGGAGAGAAGIPAIDRGFLTQAPPGNYYTGDIQAAAATAKATERTAKAVETLVVSTDRQELNFRELRLELGRPMVVNF
ncbi:MAG TPA: hypothetical protein VMY35_08060, partial [Phycisphaerae bacterium]|nr:hypothetical protein [Phycisphaerae bacterium]